MTAAGKARDWQMKYRKWFRTFTSLGQNVSNRITEHLMGTVIFRKWETLYNETAREVNQDFRESEYSQQIALVEIPETGTTKSYDLTELTTEKDLETYGVQIIKLANLLNRAKNPQGERISERLIQ